MIREIIQAPDERLLRPSLPVTRLSEGLLALANDLSDTLRRHKGNGLAAVQVGEHVRIVAVHPARFHGYRTLFNPVITARTGPMIEEDEGCLSIGEGKTYFKVRRRSDVVVTFTDRNGDERMVRSTGLAARLIQHEVDHLEGKLIA